MSLFRNTRLLSFALGHFIVDFFSGMLPILVAAHTTPLDLTQGEVGLIAFAYSLSTSLAQPLFGLLSDGAFAPRLALLGAAWQITLMGAAGFATSFEGLLAIVALGGLGSAAYHPPGAGSVPRLTARHERGGGMSVFLLGGNSGYAFGPLVAGAILNATGPRGTIYLIAGALVLMLPLALTLTRLRYSSVAAADVSLEVASALAGSVPAKAPLLGVVLLGLVVIFRSWASVSLTTYLPQYLLEQRESVAFAGTALFVMSSLGAIGGFSAGFLSDRIGIHKIIVGTMALSVPLIFAVPFVSGTSLLLVLGGLGFCTLASLPLTLILGQELFPGRPGVMTGLTLGFTFVAGGIGAAVTGSVAERVGLSTVLSWLPGLLLLGTLSALALALAQQRAVWAPRAEAESPGD